MAERTPERKRRLRGAILALDNALELMAEGHPQPEDFPDGTAYAAARLEHNVRIANVSAVRQDYVVQLAALLSPGGKR